MLPDVPGPSPGIAFRLRRGLRIIRVASWVSLLIAALASAGQTETPGVVTAILLGGVFVVVATVVRLESLNPSGVVFEIISLSAALLTVASTALTGGVGSPFVLLALMPGILASMVGGLRRGLTTSLLSSGLIAAVSAAEMGIDSLLASSGVIGLFPLMALVVAQIRSLLLEAEERATSLELAAAQAEGEAIRLAQANELLHRLTDLYGEGSANPVDVGRAAVEAIVEANPGSFATATLFDAAGPVVVARAGTDSPDLVRTQVPLGDGETTSGVVSIGTIDTLGVSQLQDIHHLLRPVAVSFSNAALLQEIAGVAVKEERLRLARELHDEVGPALAALAISLDGASLEVGDPSLTAEIDDIRTRMGTVVEDLRGIIADLRAEDVGSLSAGVRAAIANLDRPPSIEVGLHELRPPRVAAGRHILAIVTEAVRNAHRHADASRIVVSGVVDRGRVDIEVTDDGGGFDPSEPPEGHYGLMGMRERADRIGASVEIESGPSGSRVRVSWKESQ